MAELLDIYDENKNHIGTDDRNIIHQKGLWHKTIHCWIVKDNSKIIFQKRASTLNDNPAKLYTSASGHIKAGETIETAFNREIFEELGINTTNPIKLFEVKYTADFITKNNTEFHDRVFCNIFMCKDDTPLTQYKPQEEELDGVIELSITDCIDLFNDKINQINAIGYIKENEKFQLKDLKISKDDFLVVGKETCKSKYEYILKEILTKL